jgi:small neutral amino acid transporter SnatA (MarC family)
VPTKKIVNLALIAFVVFFLVTNPQGLADIFTSIGRGLRYLAEQLMAFVDSLSN